MRYYGWLYWVPMYLGLGVFSIHAQTHSAGRTYTPPPPPRYTPPPPPVYTPPPPVYTPPATTYTAPAATPGTGAIYSDSVGNLSGTSTPVSHGAGGVGPATTSRPAPSGTLQGAIDNINQQRALNQQSTDAFNKLRAATQASSDASSARLKETAAKSAGDMQQLNNNLNGTGKDIINGMDANRADYLAKAAEARDRQAAYEQGINDLDSQLQRNQQLRQESDAYSKNAKIGSGLEGIAALGDVATQLTPTGTKQILEGAETIAEAGKSIQIASEDQSGDEEHRKKVDEAVLNGTKATLTALAASGIDEGRLESAEKLTALWETDNALNESDYWTVTTTVGKEIIVESGIGKSALAIAQDGVKIGKSIQEFRETGENQEHVASELEKQAEFIINKKQDFARKADEQAQLAAQYEAYAGIVPAPSTTLQVIP